MRPVPTILRHTQIAAIVLLPVALGFSPSAVATPEANAQIHSEKPDRNNICHQIIVTSLEPRAL